MASLLLRSLNKCILNASFGQYNYVSSCNAVLGNLPRQILGCSLTTFSSKQNALPAHQEVIENKTEEEKLFAKETIALVNNQIREGKEGRLFAVIHVAGKQFKITTEDIIIVHGHWSPQPSDVILFEKVLLVGGRDFSLIGRPTLPSDLVTVKGTIIEKDLSHLKTYFVKRRRKQYQRINFIKNEHTMVRINDIIINGDVGSSENTVNPVNRIKQ